ncbi:enolase C-terminal domain-like protein [Micromonospora sp. NBRC 101691]|uniref:enolase C-terminal domain-like protein n=1 Tax=Micromonospora sp. NBRC 101691 TaxID=3032198 RepID=UPI0024A2849A|nr:enolase C-terminal domain-like protein [Micromonospora sp. NBRC 101691]GLY24468.1 dipeptide epimerase [Micromonospora sp. NBRC 101691]
MELSHAFLDIPFSLPYHFARASLLATRLVRVELRDGDLRGRGEATLFESRFPDPKAATAEQVEQARVAIGQGAGREDLLALLPAGAARNAVDAALWDLEAKRSGRRVWQMIGLPEPTPVEDMLTVSLADETQFVQELKDSQGRRALKLKLGSPEDVERLELTRAHRPDAELVVDVNCGWTPERLVAMLPVLARHDVRMVEQPVRPEHEEALRGLPRQVPLIADESFYAEEDLPRIAELYDGVNVKLDKCGGLTAALRIVAQARQRDLRIMVGCFAATSLASAAAFQVAHYAEFRDIAGHLILTEDVQPSMPCVEGRLSPPTPELWG